jgi:hypothetical protein
MSDKGHSNKPWTFKKKDLCSSIPLNWPTAWRRFVPYLSIPVTLVGICGPVSWFEKKNHHKAIKSSYCTCQNPKCLRGITLTTKTLVLLSTPFPFKRKLKGFNGKGYQNLIKQQKLTKKQKNDAYFTSCGVTIQVDVSVLSVCATNNHCKPQDKTK